MSTALNVHIRSNALDDGFDTWLECIPKLVFATTKVSRVGFDSFCRLYFNSTIRCE